MHGVLKKEHQVSQNFVRIERTRFKIILLNIFTVKQLRASLVQMQFVALMAFTRKVVLSRCEHCSHCLNYLHCQIALAAFVHCLIACHFHRWFQSAHCDLKGPRVLLSFTAWKLQLSSSSKLSIACGPIVSVNQALTTQSQNLIYCLMGFPTKELEGQIQNII